MKRLRELEDENARLKKIVADLTLDREMLQDVIKRRPHSAIGNKPPIWFMYSGDATSPLPLLKPENSTRRWSKDWVHSNTNRALVAA